MPIIHRICTLTETAQGHPRPNQFTLGDVKSHSIETNGFYIGYGGKNPNWTYGLRARYIIWKHSSGLYIVFCGPGPGNVRVNFLEASPRNGMRSRPYCEQTTHDWRWFRCSGWDNTDPGNPIWIQERMQRFNQQPPKPSIVTPSTPWIIGNYEIHEIIPSIPYTLSGFALPQYSSAVSDPENGEELD